MSDKIRKLPVVHRSRDMALELVRYDPEKPCTHLFTTYRIREGEAEAECGKCSARLEPMWVLKQLALMDSLYSRRSEAAVRTAEEIEKRVRTKCQHCGKMTRIRNL